MAGQREQGTGPDGGGGAQSAHVASGAQVQQATLPTQLRPTMSQLGQQLLAELSGAAESAGLPSEACCSGLLTHLDPRLHV